MSALRGFAARKHSGAGGFHYRLPKARSWVLRYYAAQAEQFLALWLIETAMCAEKRSSSNECDVTKEDVDQGFSAVVNISRYTPWTPRVQFRRRRDEIRYDPPSFWPEDVVAYFEQAARSFLNEWSSEIEKAANDGWDASSGDPKVTPRIVDGARLAAFIRTVHRRDATNPPGSAAAKTSLWQHVFRRYIVRWIGGILAAVGGGTGLWTFVQDQLTSAQQSPSRLVTAIALILVGLLVAVFGGSKG